MPEVEIEIGGRTFTVACQEGEEPYLRAAAKMLNTEATVVLGQIGRMPSDRMLLMAGLMLADKTAALEDELRETQAKVGAQEKALDLRDQALSALEGLDQAADPLRWLAEYIVDRQN